MSIAEQLRLAAKCLDLGFVPIPLLPTGKKHPAVKWSSYKEAAPSRREVADWFCKPQRGFAILGGNTSGGLESLDFDNHYKKEEEAEDTVFQRWWISLPKTIRNKLVLIRTPGYGWRVPWLFKGDYDWTTMVLAYRTETEASIEYHRSWLQMFPGGSPLHHKTGKPYIWWRGSLETIPTISEEERRICVDNASALSSYVPPKIPQRMPQRESLGNKPAVIPGTKYFHAWMDFDANGTWQEILEPLGWVQVGRSYSPAHWRRPGKSDGVSATTDHYEGKFFCFSSSVAGLEQGKSYSRTALYAILHCDGDFTEANKRLGKLNYGLPSLSVLEERYRQQRQLTN